MYETLCVISIVLTVLLICLILSLRRLIKKGKAVCAKLRVMQLEELRNTLDTESYLVQMYNKPRDPEVLKTGDRLLTDLIQVPETFKGMSLGGYKSYLRLRKEIDEYLAKYYAGACVRRDNALRCIKANVPSNN